MDKSKVFISMGLARGGLGVGLAVSGDFDKKRWSKEFNVRSLGYKKPRGGYNEDNITHVVDFLNKKHLGLTPKQAQDLWHEIVYAFHNYRRSQKGLDPIECLHIRNGQSCPSHERAS